MHQRSSVPVRPSQTYFGTSAVTRTVHVSPSSRTPTSICVALRMRARIRPRFSVTHFTAHSGAFEHNATVYVLFDGPGRVFLGTERNLRIFGNVWSLNGSLIFRGSRHVSPSRFLLSDVSSDRFGVLEGEQLVRLGVSSVRGNFWYCEQQVVFHDSESGSQLNHRCLRPILTTSSADRPAGGDIHIRGLDNLESPGFAPH
jgi:hypothetical protein